MGNLSTVRCLSELNKDDPVSEGGRQEGSDKKQLEKVVSFFLPDSYGIKLYNKNNTKYAKNEEIDRVFLFCKNELKLCDF